MKKRSNLKKDDLLSGKGQRLWKRAKKIIPGGNQLLSKRAEMFLPDLWPAYYSKAKAVYIWDLDGRKYLDMSLMAVGACALGYADFDVNKAVANVVRRGSISTLNAPEEVELAELLCSIHPWAHMVRYARAGGESMAIAARIARAYTGRDIIAFCGYHGWADWYLATNLKDPKGLNDHLLSGLEPKGVPQGLRGTILPFHYNQIDELEKIVKENDGKIAAIIMEPVHSDEPKDNFLQKVRAIADKTGAVLVFDEITIGWKLTFGGAHLHYKVNPDMAIFGKALSNGYPMAAIIGKREVMQAAQGSFISSSYWTDRIGPAAALATIKKMKHVGLSQHLIKTSLKIKEIWKKTAAKHGIAIETAEVPVILTIAFKGEDGNEAKTLFTQEMLQCGILAGGIFYASYAHTDAHIARYARAVDEVFGIIAKARKTGGVKKLLKGPVAHTGFQRLN
ncbi:aminotransferase class III [Candidatus Kaiserbacteria bacterium RIFCSPHIGHO2_01_FULL_53_29]|uniref:Aminotransferase class III n=1 Tax=Candidatus Kaiserbacteria bacterium RIFCSPHIGHO2_01_FULL_53_29 TaxID=1798480 RepID=A0A1F6CX41_9BACT|nr:MAG: aminotransferase class III [Candidatus Kaiserbacteria bacterium RIFCSPHIGHO2_01_FULL_53_29]